MSLRWRAVDLDGARPDGVVVVIDVLRAFTFEAWAFERGAARILAVDEPERALHIARTLLPGSLAAGERGGRPLDGFDLGNSPLLLDAHALAGRTIVHRTSAGTQGLARTAGAPLVLAASFVTAGATARLLRERGVDDVTFVVTGDSLGRARHLARRLCEHRTGQRPVTSTGAVGSRVAQRHDPGAHGDGLAVWQPDHQRHRD